MRTRGVLLCVVLCLSLSACLRDPAVSPSIVASKLNVALTEQLTLTVTGLENWSCIEWSEISGNSNWDYAPQSGIIFNEPTVILEFSSPGTFEFEVAVKNCNPMKRGDEDCDGNCREEYASVTIRVE